MLCQSAKVRSAYKKYIRTNIILGMPFVEDRSSLRKRGDRFVNMSQKLEQAKYLTAWN